ncbi:glycosyltransferase WbsX family protein [Anaeromicropila herbilytica]|uniref:Glycosyltransferase WbsX n=1 Tax=Anaeromicropila herbilytica TaxID=2785025 RepID=A0A7R7EPU3_9FIRM|nr:glycoside hydrolase family 99-like domain-containing protein [Anaeromicropila herbilytica]BCN32282.1 hypothetical protein bsdtb5_35770 [Anaeromicropila herbilytica]
MANALFKKIFWKLPISQSFKNRIYQKRFKRILDREKIYDEQGNITITNDSKLINEYVKYVFGLYGKKSDQYSPYVKHKKIDTDIHLVAYYLTQFHQNMYNDEWWGKGTTEWNNVNQAVPQFVGHYQPRKPGELGYYDLKSKNTFVRQIELAQNYGIEAFCYYYYWFDNGERLLDYPLNLFLENKDLDMKFFYCWANENWTRRFSGTNDDILMKITSTVDNYQQFIESVISDMKDERYYRINGKPVLSVYLPSSIPEPEKVLSYWREKAISELKIDLYIIAVQERDITFNWMKVGFDAESEFQPKQIYMNCKNITKKVNPIRSDFAGVVYDYADAVKEKGYISTINQKKKVFPAVMPMWDNTARRNFRGSVYHGSTPELYREWLSDIVGRMKKREEFEDKLIFINAWNEWGEGAYIEPDDFYGYAYLEATYQALNDKK